MTRQNYPFPFKTKPIENASLQSSGAACFLYPESGGDGVNSSYQTAIYNVARPTAMTSEQTFHISIYAYGELL